MSFDFHEIKVLNLLKDLKMNPKELKGVPDEKGRIWPFGSDKAREASKRKR